MFWPLQLFYGFLVGLAGLLPGLCGSTLLVLFGLYRPLTAALAHPFRDFRGQLLRFGPFFVAAGLGIACLPEVAIREAVAAGQLIALATPFLDLRRRLSLLVPRKRYRGAALAAFLRMA